MALGTAVELATWQACCDDVETTDNSGNDITAVDTQVARSEQHIINISGTVTRLSFRLRYDDGATPSQDPVLQIFGRQPNGFWIKLDEITPDPTIASDVQDGTYAYTAPITVSVSPYTEVIAAVKTDFQVSGGVDTSTLQVYPG